MAFELGGIPPNPVAVQVHPVAPEQVNDRDLEVLVRHLPCILRYVILINSDLRKLAMFKFRS